MRMWFHCFLFDNSEDILDLHRDLKKVHCFPNPPFLNINAALVHLLAHISVFLQLKLNHFSAATHNFPVFLIYQPFSELLLFFFFLHTPPTNFLLCMQLCYILFLLSIIQKNPKLNKFLAQPQLELHSLAITETLFPAHTYGWPYNIAISLLSFHIYSRFIQLLFLKCS